MKALKFLLIIGTCVGLEAAAMPQNLPPMEESTVYWSPDKNGFQGHIKRAPNGDRI